MDPYLVDFLARQVFLARESAAWDEGRLALQVTAYLGAELPPVEYVTSVRAIVLRPGCVLTVRDAGNHTHIWPGGRREPGETLEETVRREVLEETGWTLQELSLLGCVHFHHLNAKPPGYLYPHPDFLQTVYVAQAGALVPGARIAGGYEREAVFRPIATVERLDLPKGQRLFLQAALEKHSAPP